MNSVDEKAGRRVLLVPGIFDQMERMKEMAHYLQESGFHASVVSPQPNDGSVGLDVLAKLLADHIEREVLAAQPLALVGFSMGGLICRYYVQQLDTNQRTQQLITLSTPHRGTYSGYLFNRPAPMQMRPGSQFLRELNQDLSVLQRLDFTSMWTPFDLTILPANSSRLPVGTMLYIPTLIHRFVVNDPRVWKAVAERLKGKSQ